MRILLAASIYPPDPGGPALHAKAFYEWLDNKGHEPGLLALSHYRRWPSGIRHLIYLAQLIRSAPYFDTVYSYDALGVGIPALLASHIKGKNLVIRIGGDVVWERYAETVPQALSMNAWYLAGKHKHNIRFWLSRWILRRANAIIVPSPILAHILRRYYGVEMRTITIIPNPLSGNELGTSSIDRSIVFASRLVKYKNLDMVIRAIKPLIEADTKLKLVIIGDGPENDNLRKLADSLGIKEQIEFTGTLSQEKVMELTSRCLITIAPAITEFNPNYVLQGITMRKPFLISSENGLPFTVPEEFTFNPRDEKMLRDKLKLVISDSGYKEAQQKLESLNYRVTWEEVMKANVQVLESINK